MRGTKIQRIVKIMSHRYRQLNSLIKTKGIYSDIVNFVESRLDNLNDGLMGPLPKGKNKKVIVLMKDGLGQKIMKEFAAVRTKACSYLTGNNN